MKIEKLTNNTYRVRQQYKRKRYTVYFDHKPTQKEVLLALSEKLENNAPVTQQETDTGTLDEYIIKYIALKEKQTKPPISPSTIRGYESIQRNISDELKSKEFFQLTSDDIQAEIKEYKRTHSVKSTKNMYGLIASVFGEFRPKEKLVVKLPTAEPKAEYEPTTKDIQAILEYVQGTEYSIPLQLAVLGLRRGEICALTVSDLSEDNILTINKDIVVDKNNKIITKGTKTEASNRRIAIPGKLADEIREKGYIYKGYPNSIARFLHSVQDKLSIPRFRLHMLRHFSVAYLHKQGFTEEQIMAWGGWSTSDVMQRAYRYNLDPEESQKEMANTFNSLI